MAKRSRTKGMRNEQAIVAALREAGIQAERVPLSGSAKGSFAGDVAVGNQRFEAKIRASGFKQIYEWLADHRGLFIRGDRKELLIVLRAADWIELRRRRDEL